MSFHKIQIKPMSVNQAWVGRRRNSFKYLKYKTDIMRMLPNYTIPEGKLTLYLYVGFSSKGSDVDNIAKPFIDILQKKYDFNDNRIYLLIMEKTIVKKGAEYIEFEILPYE